MKKFLLYFLMAGFAISEAAVTPGEAYVSLGYGVPAGMSPNGRYAVGNNSGNSFQSCLFDSETGEVEWLTQCDISNPEFDFDLSGQFFAVNDEGIIAGACKDKDMMMYWDDGWDAFYQPLMTAAIWKEGKLTKLGIGDFQPTDFLNMDDGSAATAISADGKKVVGYVMRGNTAYYTPCGWDYDDVKDEWIFSRYALPAGAANGEIGGISADGSIAVGYAKTGMVCMPVYWTSPDTCVSIELTPEDQANYGVDFNWNYAYSVSPNGNYILFTLNQQIPCVYNVNEKTYKKIGINPDAGNLSIRAVADNGETAGTFIYGNFFSGFRNEAFWYSYDNDVMTTFSYFTGLYAAEPENLPSFETAEFRSVSADGSRFFGSTNGNMWVLSVNTERFPIPAAVENVYACNDEPSRLNITWEPVSTLPEGFTLDSYRIYLDDEELSVIGNDEKCEVTADGLKSGVHTIQVEQLFTDATGRSINSPKSKELQIGVTDSFAIPLFDDFESNSFNTNFWTVKLLEGRVFDDLKWQFRGSYDNNQTINLADIVMTTEPYSSAVETRFLDATSLDAVYVSFAREMMYGNRDDWDLTGDWLSLELSYDGKDWATVRDYLARDIVAGRWVYEKIDITSEAAGKRFKLRLRTHGDGRAQLLWYVDNFKVGSNDDREAPQGLQAEVEDGKVNLFWKNTINAYELSYFENSNFLYEVTIGDEGNPFIVANSFDAGQLESYTGKYITSVTTFLYDSPWIETENPTKSAIMVFEDNTIIFEQEIEAYPNGETFTVKLDCPVMIAEGKEYKIGMKIYDYHPEQMPIYYQVSELFEQWKSDLFSQDGGKTWQSLCEYYSDKEGYEDWGMCIWPMRANVTDEEEVYDNYLLDPATAGYIVYRNGERISDKLSYPTYLKYVDEAPLSSATYEVAAFFTDGTSSAKSEPCVVKLTSVKGVEDDSISVYPNPATDYIRIAGEFDSASLYSLQGSLMTRTSDSIMNVSGVEPGVYILTIERQGTSTTRRVIVR